MKTALEKYSTLLSAAKIAGHCSSAFVLAAKSISTSAHSACSCLEVAMLASPVATFRP
jgi:hypothetical protein